LVNIPGGMTLVVMNGKLFGYTARENRCSITALFCDLAWINATVKIMEISNNLILAYHEG